MKLLLLVVAAAGVAQGAVTCDECQAAAQDFVSHLLTEESLAEQVQLMKDNVCPQLGIDGCEGILDMWYADMATCIFNHFIIEGDACSLAGLCYVREWPICRETVSVALRVTPRTAPLSWRPWSPSPCPSLPLPLLGKLWSIARRLLESARVF